jgi:hypothetical protein
MRGRYYLLGRGGERKTRKCLRANLVYKKIEDRHEATVCLKAMKAGMLNVGITGEIKGGREKKTNQACCIPESWPES